MGQEDAKKAYIATVVGQFKAHGYPDEIEDSITQFLPAEPAAGGGEAAPAATAAPDAAADAGGDDIIDEKIDVAVMNVCPQPQMLEMDGGFTLTHSSLVPPPSPTFSS